MGTKCSFPDRINRPRCFSRQWQRLLIENGEVKRQRACRLSIAEIVTIIIHFHQSHFRGFTFYYLHYVYGELKDYSLML